METIYINGKYLSQPITGVQRYAREVVRQFDENDEYKDYTFKVICPENAIIPQASNRIEYIKIKRKGYPFEQISLPKYLKKNKAKILLNLCNVAPMKFPGMVVIHDMNVVDNKSFYSFSYRNIVKLITKRNIKKYQKIFTVSNFSKSRIEDYYHINNVITTHCGVNGRSIIKACDKFDFADKKFYLTVASMNKTKNIGYIIKVAKNNPNKLFVIAGGMAKIYQSADYEHLNNVIFTGYLTDDELFYLYSRCEALIFPSLYEGFGIPPLEAASCGVKRIIVSDIPVFHELFEDYVSFCNPYDPKTIDSLLDESKTLSDEECMELVNKYSWNKVAEKIFAEVKEKL